MALAPLQSLLSKQQPGSRHGLKPSETSVVAQKLSKCKQMSFWLKVDMHACEVSNQLARFVQMQQWDSHSGVSCNRWD